MYPYIPHTGSISDIFMGFEFQKDRTEIIFWEIAVASYKCHKPTGITIILDA